MQIQTPFIYLEMEQIYLNKVIPFQIYDPGNFLGKAKFLSTCIKK